MIENISELRLWLVLASLANVADLANIW